MKTRKFLAVVLAVAMLASFISVPVFADGHEGGILEDLGILIGVDEDGVTEDYLASTATRAQAALVHLRLFGLEADALAFEGAETFADAATATEYWQPVLEYLKANPELGWQGDDEGNFMPTAAINGQQFTKVLLVALGYVEDTDFTYDETMTFAESIGLDALADMAAEDLTMEDVAVALVQALGLKTTDVEDWTLISKLVAAGLVDGAAAEAAGFVVEDPAFVVVSAEATGQKTVEVVMSTDIPDGTTIQLKKGTIGIVTTAEVDGAMATLTGLFNFAPGTYTVMVGEAVSAPFAIEAQTAVDLTIGAETIYITGAQDLMVKLEDQYGGSMNLGAANISVFNTDTGFVFTPDVGTTVKITPGDDGALEAGDEVYIFVYDPASQFQATATVLVQADPYLAGLTVEGWTWNIDDDETDARFYTGDMTAVMDVYAWDQYENEYVLTNADITTGTVYANVIQVLSSNGDVLSAGAVGVNGDGDLTFEAGNPGTAMFTFIIPDQAVVVSTEMITVYAQAVLTTVSDFVVVGAEDANGQVIALEGNTVTAVGKDQYGEVVEFTSADAGDFSFTTNNTMVLLPGGVAVGTDELTITPLDDGTVTVFVFLNGALQGSFDLTVMAEAAPLYISDVEVEDAMQTGVYDTVMSGDITVMDQYNREMTGPLTGYWSYVIQPATAQEHVVITGSAASYLVTTAGLSAGTDTFTALLTDDSVVQEESGHAFSVRNVAASEIDGLTVTVEEGTMYVGPEYDMWGAAASDYYKDLTIKGTADGLEVKLLLDGNGVPEIVDLITTTNDNVEIDYMTLEPAIPLTGNAAGTATIKVWRNGVAEAMTDVELDIADPDLTSIDLTELDTINWDTQETFAITAFIYTDQYGVVMSGTMVLAASSPDGDTDYILYEWANSAGDFEIVDETELWWFTVVKYDGTVWKTRYIDIDDIFPTPS